MAAEAMPVAAELKAEVEGEGGLTYTWRPAATSAVAAAKAEAPQRALKRLRGGGDTGGDHAASTPGACRSTTSRYFAAAQREGRGSDQVKVES